MNIDWKNLLSLVGALLLLINFSEIKEYIQVSSPFASLNYLPMAQRNLVIIGIVLVSWLIIRELRNAR